MGDQIRKGRDETFFSLRIICICSTFTRLNTSYLFRNMVLPTTSRLKRKLYIRGDTLKLPRQYSSFLSFFFPRPQGKSRQIERGLRKRITLCAGMWLVGLGVRICPAEELTHTNAQRSMYEGHSSTVCNSKNMEITSYQKWNDKIKKKKRARHISM